MYKKAMDLTIYFEKIVRNFSRCHKYTLLGEIAAREDPFDTGKAATYLSESFRPR